MNISFQPEFNNVCLVDRYNYGDYLILIKMDKKLRWTVDYIFDSGVGCNVKHFKTIVSEDLVHLSYMKDQISEKLLAILESQTNMLIRKVKRNKAFL